MSKDIKIQRFFKTAGLVTVLVIMQQLIASGLFGFAFDWPAVPFLVLINLGIVAAWYYFRTKGVKLPVFVVFIASFFFTAWLRAVILYTGVFRLIAMPVASFAEKQIVAISSLLLTPQFLPAMLAALLLLLLLPKAKKVYGRFIYREFLIPPQTFE